MLAQGVDFADALHLTSSGGAERLATFDAQWVKRAPKMSPVPVALAKLRKSSLASHRPWGPMIVELNGSTPSFDVSAETLRCTIGLDRVGDVNVEMALRLADRLGGLLIPHTPAVTALGELKVGARVNLEVDLVARYVARLHEG